VADEDRVFSQAAIRFPLQLASVTANTALRDADPAVWRALDFFTAMTRTQIGDRLIEAAAAAGLSEITDAVMQSIPYDPADHFTSTQFTFPLLAIYRKSEKFAGQSGLRDKAVSAWTVQWSLPPLTAGQMEQLTPLLHAFAAVIRRHAIWSYHPDYESGLYVWDSVSVQGAVPLGVSYGAMQGADGLVFPTAMVDLEVTERDMDVAGAFEAMAGVDGEIDMADEASVTVETIADLDIVPDE
jgi:hypothetical protein